jgi:hypothetical protein
LPRQEISGSWDGISGTWFSPPAFDYRVYIRTDAFETCLIDGRIVAYRALHRIDVEGPLVVDLVSFAESWGMTAVCAHSRHPVGYHVRYFPLSDGVARVDDRRIKNGLRWRDRTRRSTIGLFAGAAWGCSTRFSPRWRTGAAIPSGCLAFGMAGSINAAP